MGHYATNFPLKKSNKGSSEGEALASQFKMDFTLITCMVSSMMGCVWYLDSGASFHMIDDKSLFSSLEEKDLKMHTKNPGFSQAFLSTLQAPISLHCS